MESIVKIQSQGIDIESCKKFNLILNNYKQAVRPPSTGMLTPVI